MPTAGAHFMHITPYHDTHVNAKHVEGRAFKDVRYCKGQK